MGLETVLVVHLLVEIKFSIPAPSQLECWKRHDSWFLHVSWYGIANFSPNESRFSTSSFKRSKIPSLHIHFSSFQISKYASVLNFLLLVKPIYLSHFYCFLPWNQVLQGFGIEVERSFNCIVTGKSKFVFAPIVEGFSFAQRFVVASEMWAVSLFTTGNRVTPIKLMQGFVTTAVGKDAQ